jgi:hypothetical protein
VTRLSSTGGFERVLLVIYLLISYWTSGRYWEVDLEVVFVDGGDKDSTQGSSRLLIIFLDIAPIFNDESR